MAGPLALAGHAGRLPALMRSAQALISRAFTRTPTVVASAARRTGITGGASRILSAAKNNKVLTALILFELGDEGMEMLNRMAEEDAEIAEMISRYGVTNDPIEEGAIGKISMQIDEMQTIAEAANTLGGIGRLHTLRRALMLTEDHYKFYDELKAAGEVLR